MRIPSDLFVFAGSALVGSLLGSCTQPKLDCYRSQGCAAPDPTGVMEGSVVYVGSRPQCLRDGDGSLRQPIAPIGNVVLTLFDYNNPPPPTGSASSALNLLTIPGATLFGAMQESDCLPNNPTLEDRAATLMRSAPFIWPELALGSRDSTDGTPSGVEYQVRGFFDTDGDFNPLYSVRNLPTAGDVAGGAFTSAFSARPTFERIAFDHVSNRPLGQRVVGVTVTLGAVVNTERPVFRASWTPLDSAATIPLTSNPVELEQSLFDMTGLTVELIPESDARYFGDAGQGVTGALQIAGYKPDTSPERYAFFVQDVDANADGVGDMHPILGSAGIPWKTPIVLLQRARSAVETQAGIPDVLLIGTVRPSQIVFNRAFSPSAQIAVAPIAVMKFAASNLQCTAALAAAGTSAVPIVPAGNITSFYEQVPSTCQEVPSGRYRINVIQGVAGGTLQTTTPGFSEACDGDECYLWSGGSLSGQAWSVPNELGSAAQLCTPEGLTAGTCAFLNPAMSLLDEQGVNAQFIVTDLTPESVGDEAAGCTQALDPAMMAARAIQYQAVPEPCCASVRHLCNVPLCDASTASHDEADFVVRGGPTTVTNGVPDCVPFQMPTSCCESL